MNFETETPAGYITIEQAAQARIGVEQYWELHPDVTITGHAFDENGNITADVELTERAAITDMEVWDESGNYNLYGNQDGENFTLEAGIDPWTPVRLVDAR